MKVPQDTMAKHRKGVMLSKMGIKRVALVGTGHGHQLAPTTGHVWVMNDLGCYIYATMIWDMHNFEWTDQENYEHYSHMSEEISEEKKWKRVKGRKKRFAIIADFCRKRGVPLMSVKKYANIPSSYAYPLRKIIDFFNVPVYQSGDFLNSALSQAIAYAIYRDFNVIDMYGINVEMGTEWIYQRDAVSYWCGFARGQGRIVTNSGTARRPTRIIDKKVYGYEEEMVQFEPGVEFVVQAPQNPKSFIKVWDESRNGHDRHVEAIEKKEPGPHGKLWKTSKEGVFVMADWGPAGPPDAVREAERRLPQDEATIEITEAAPTYRFQAPAGAADEQAGVGLRDSEIPQLGTLPLSDEGGEDLEGCERRREA